MSSQRKPNEQRAPREIRPTFLLLGIIVGVAMGLAGVFLTVPNPVGTNKWTLGVAMMGLGVLLAMASQTQDSKQNERKDAQMMSEFVTNDHVNYYNYTIEELDKTYLTLVTMRDKRKNVMKSPISARVSVMVKLEKEIDSINVAMHNIKGNIKDRT